MNLPETKLDPILFTWFVDGRRVTLLRVCNAMERYISPIMVATVLEAALRAQGPTSGPPSLRKFIDHCMVGLRLFVPKERLPDLVLELNRILENDS